MPNVWLAIRKFLNEIGADRLKWSEVERIYFDGTYWRIKAK